MTNKNLKWIIPVTNAQATEEKKRFDKLASKVKLNEAFDSGDPAKAMDAIFKLAKGMCKGQKP